MPKSNLPSILDLRRENLRKLIKARGGAGALAKQLGHRSGSYLSQIAGPNPTRDISEPTAREIEAKLGLSMGWLDRREDDAAPSGGLDAPTVAEIVRQVMTVTAELKHPPSATKVAEVVSLAYERAATTGQVDPQFVQRLLKLAE